MDISSKFPLNKESPSLISVTRRDPRIDTVELGNLGFYFFQAKTILKNKKPTAD